MDILRNGKKIGYNKYSFKNQNDLLVVKNEINFVIFEFQYSHDIIILTMKKFNSISFANSFLNLIVKMLA